MNTFEHWKSSKIRTKVDKKDLIGFNCFKWE